MWTSTVLFLSLRGGAAGFLLQDGRDKNNAAMSIVVRLIFFNGSIPGYLPIGK